MDFATIMFGLIAFGLAYQGLGLFMQTRQSRSSAWARGSLAPSSPSAGWHDFIGKISQTGLNRLLLRSVKFRESLELPLIRSGNVFGWKAEDLLFYKELGAALMLMLAWHSGQTQLLVWIGGPCLGFFIPELYVKAKGRVRQAEIQRQLPGLVDLIALALESGLDLLAAIERIVGKMKPNALREELQTLIQENRLGAPRKEVLQRLAFRVPSSDMQSLTSMIIQSEELGTSLATMLRAYAEDMRGRRIVRAEEAAGKAPVKILFPMMVFFFPIVFVIIFGPLALNFMASPK